MANQAQELEKQLNEEIKKGEIRLKKFHDRLIINIDEKISFDSGKAVLKKNVVITSYSIHYTKLYDQKFCTHCQPGPVTLDSAS